jgi:hypothetical protein
VGEFWEQAQVVNMRNPPQGSDAHSYLVQQQLLLRARLQQRKAESIIQVDEEGGEAVQAAVPGASDGGLVDVGEVGRDEPSPCIVDVVPFLGHKLCGWSLDHSAVAASGALREGPEGALSAVDAALSAAMQPTGDTEASSAVLDAITSYGLDGYVTGSLITVAQPGSKLRVLETYTEGFWQPKLTDFFSGK